MNIAPEGYRRVDEKVGRRKGCVDSQGPSEAGKRNNGYAWTYSILGPKLGAVTKSMPGGICWSEIDGVHVRAD
jgi:hypothetical protein